MRIFTNTSKIPYVRATEGFAQDWIRRIDNKQSRTRGEASFYLPVQNFLRNVAFRSFGAPEEPPTLTRGEENERKTDDRGSRRSARWRGRAKGKDLNGLSQKAFSYSPWQTTMAKWREREHILNRFPSSAMYLCGAQNQRRLGPAAVCIYCLDALGEDSPLLSGGRVSNLKGLKRFPRRVARRIVGPRTPIDRRLFRSFFASCALRSLVALDPFPPLSLSLPFRLWLIANF